MKKHILVSIVFSFFATLVSAQLTLKEKDGSKKINIPIGTFINLKMPIISLNSDSCDCYTAYEGELVGASKDTAKIIISNTYRLYKDIDGVNKNSQTNYQYPKEKIVSSVVLKNLISVTKLKKGENPEGLGSTLMAISLFQGLVINPFLKDKSRKTSNIIMWSTFSTGLALYIFPTKKTFHFQQPKKGEKVKLWLLATP
jgi:hypothetical protein